MLENPPLPAEHLLWLTMFCLAGWLIVNIGLAQSVPAEKREPHHRLVDLTPILGGLLVIVLYQSGAEGMAYFTTPLIAVSWACIWFGSFSVFRKNQ